MEDELEGLEGDGLFENLETEEDNQDVEINKFGSFIAGIRDSRVSRVGGYGF